MSLSNAAKLPNPFDLTDSQILDKVYLTHLHDDDKCDKDVLFDIVSNVILKVMDSPSLSFAFCHLNTLLLIYLSFYI